MRLPDRIIAPCRTGCLELVQLGVLAAECHQLGVPALLDDAAINADLIAEDVRTAVAAYRRNEPISAPSGRGT
jgi:hypothetical protein